MNQIKKIQDFQAYFDRDLIENLCYVSHFASKIIFIEPWYRFVNSYKSSIYNILQKDLRHESRR